MKTAGNGIDFFGAMPEKAFFLAQAAEICGYCGRRRGIRSSQARFRVILFVAA